MQIRLIVVQSLSKVLITSPKRHKNYATIFLESHLKRHLESQDRHLKKTFKTNILNAIHIVRFYFHFDKRIV